MASILLWLSLGFFAFMVVYRVIKIGSMPLHLRWELYPLPHDPNHEHGGSFMEEVDFIQKERKQIKINALKEMAAEIFLLKKVRLHNKYGVWGYSLAMHWGIYLVFGWLALLVAEKFLPGIAPVTQSVGTISAVMGSIGCLGLIVKRMTTPELATYTEPIDYFNLSFLYLIFFSGLIGAMVGDGFQNAVRAYMSGDLAFGPDAYSYLTWGHFTLVELFFVYMPFSRLFHYVAKYFTIDKVFWDDAVTTKGSDIEKRVQAQLSYKVNWSGAHIKQGGTWVDQVMITDAREAKK